MQRNPALRRLDALAGDWNVTVRAGDQEFDAGRASFAWIEDGAFLLSRADADFDPESTPAGWIANSPFPVTVIIGLDDFSETFTYAYSDGRGVSRVYTMRLDGDRWEIEGRAGADFFQRFAGTFSPDGDRIESRWERSTDGVAWELDFEGVYTRA